MRSAGGGFATILGATTDLTYYLDEARALALTVLN